MLYHTIMKIKTIGIYIVKQEVYKFSKETTKFYSTPNIKSYSYFQSHASVCHGLENVFVSCNYTLKHMSVRRLIA